MTTLKAERKSISIKAKQLRREDFVTENIFGREIPESTPVKMEGTVAERLLKTCSKGSQILLDVDGQVFDVLIKDICSNSIKGLVEEVGSQAFVSDEKVHPVAKITLLNHDEVIDGAPQQWIREISYKTLPDAIVDKIKVDVGNMEVGDIVRVGNLDIAKNKSAELVTDLDTTVTAITAVYAAAETADEAVPEVKQARNVL